MGAIEGETQKHTLARSSFESSSQRLLLAIWLGLSVVYSGLIYLQIQHHLWFDELLTYFVAKAPTLRQVFELVQHWDLSPALYHSLAHVSLQWAHGNILATRYPSVLAFYLASLFLFLYSRRKLSAAYAALPVLLLWYSPVFQYATEARPYALLCCFFCGLLLLRDLGLANARRKWLLAGIALCSLGLLVSHVLGVLSLVPFMAAELVRYRERRQTDYPLWCALFLPLCLVVIYFPFFASYSAITDYPYAFQASPMKAASFYWHTLLGILPPLTAALLVGLLVNKGKWRWRLPAWPNSESILFAAILLVPIVLDLTMMIGHAPFWGRYCITSALALYFLVPAFFTEGLSWHRRAGLLAAFCACLVLLVARFIVPVAAHPRPTNASFLEHLQPNLPIVAASGLTFVEMGQYESPALTSRLFYLLDRKAAVRFAHATMFEDLQAFSQDFHLAGTVESYASFTHGHSSFLVFGTVDYPEDWLLLKLAADHAKIVPLGVFRTPYKDKTVFLVNLSHSASAAVPPKAAGAAQHHRNPEWPQSLAPDLPH